MDRLEFRDIPTTKIPEKALPTEMFAQSQPERVANWEQMARAVQANTTKPAIVDTDKDTPDNGDLVFTEKPINTPQPPVPPKNSEVWFPININLPGQGGSGAGNGTTPTPPVDEKKQRQQLIVIFAISLLLLLLVLVLFRKKAA